MRTRVLVPLFLLGITLLGMALAARDRSIPAPLIDGMDWLEGSMPTATSSPQARTFQKEVEPYTDRGIEVPRAIFETHYADLGPTLMLDVLNEDPLCHVAAHELGRVIYAHTQNIVDSLAICQSKCADGCIHGALLELYGAPEGPDDPDPAALTPSSTKALATTCDNTAITSVIGRANCYHAIGHVLDAFAEASTSRAIGLCDSLFKAQNPNAAYFCASGVYMQESLTVDVASHTMRDVASCAKNPYPAACYRFYLYGAFHTQTNPIEEASAYCATLSGYQRLGCFNGVGADWYVAVHRDPAALNTLCTSGDASDMRMCLEGALELLNVYDPGESLRACAIYSGNAADCAEAARYKNFDMRRDLANYLGR